LAVTVAAAGLAGCGGAAGAGRGAGACGVALGLGAAEAVPLAAGCGLPTPKDARAASDSTLRMDSSRARRCFVISEAESGGSTDLSCASSARRAFS